MKNKVLILLFILLLAVGALYVYQQYGDKIYKAVAPGTAFSADDDRFFQQMKEIFQSADTGNTYDWMAPLINDKYTGALPLDLLVQGKRSKTGAFTSGFYQYFFDFAQGGPKTLENGQQYQVGGGYDRNNLSDAIYHLWITFKNKWDVAV